MGGCEQLEGGVSAVGQFGLWVQGFVWLTVWRDGGTRTFVDARAMGQEQ